MKDSPLRKGDELYLWQFYLYHDTEKGKDYLLLLAHHSILDGDSIFKLLQEMLGQVRVVMAVVMEAEEEEEGC